MPFPVIKRYFEIKALLRPEAIRARLLPCLQPLLWRLSIELPYQATHKVRRKMRFGLQTSFAATSLGEGRPDVARQEPPSPGQRLSHCIALIIVDVLCFCRYVKRSLTTFTL